MATFFERLRQQVGFHNNSTSDFDTEMEAGDTEAQESDGYLLVGDSFSASQRTTRPGSDHHLQGPDAPPSYSQAIGDDGLPSYERAISGDYTSSPMSPSQASQIQFIPDQLGTFFTQSRNRNAVSDIPFQLHPSLETEQLIQRLYHGIDLEPSTFNWAKYSHNFNQEKLYLREMNCQEEIDISEFSQVPSGSNDLSVVHDDRDLMTF